MIRIRGGCIVDPANGVDGEVRDLWIQGGRIVAPPSPPVSEAEVLDAEGMVVLPGGVDLHSHVAGGKENMGRKLRPEDHREHVRPREGSLRSGSGFTVPSVFLSGYLYAEMGYTTVMEAASAPLFARHAQEELEDLPMVDKGLFITLGNNHFVLECLARGEEELLHNYVAWLLRATGAYAAKVVNPGGVENWKWGRNVSSLDEEVLSFGVTPRKILSGLAESVRKLGLPHPLHVHGINLGQARSAGTTVDTVKTLDGLGGHLCHLQFLSYEEAGEGSSLFRSAASRVATALEATTLSLDVGQIVFGGATTMTSDGPLEYALHRLTGAKWINDDVEGEGGGGVLPLSYDRRSRLSAEQWITGLELFLLLRDPWRLALTTDHPNGGPFFCYPQIMRLLRDRSYREEVIATLPPKVRSGALLPSLDREYSLSEIAVITRAAPARILGLRNKGHLGIGADADVALYDRVFTDGTPCRCAKYPSCRRALSRVRHLVKGGEVVIRDGKIVKEVSGRRLCVVPPFDESLEPRLRKQFSETYSVAFENYALEEGEFPHREVVPCSKT